jgi:tRNA(adenine34) deaminase
MKTVHDARDARYMGMALTQAKKAIRVDEVPVGAVVVLDGKVIGRGHNLTRRRKDPTAHAEVVALRQAAKRLRNDRLAGAELFCTLEPCPMCAGAIVHARIRRVVFGALDPKAGACGSVVKVLPNRKLNHRPDVVRMVMADEAAALLTDFFKVRRALRKKQKAL